MCRRKRKEQSLAQAASHYNKAEKISKLRKKDLEIIIDGAKFEFIDIPFYKKRKKNGR